MDKATTKFIRRRFSILLITAALITACATLPPAKPIQDMKSIAGKWEGRMDITDVGTTAVVATFKEDGTWEWIVPHEINPLVAIYGTRLVGTGNLSQGKYRFKFAPAGITGDYTLHEGGGRRMLVFGSDEGRIRGFLEPARK